MKTRIHVNQHLIKSNRKNGANEPPLTVKDYRQNRKMHTAVILDSDGAVVAKVVYRPEKPLPCGATCWVETDLEVESWSSEKTNKP